VRLYPFIEAEKSQGSSVKRACELLKVSRAAYYAARDPRPSSREQGDAELTARIEAVHEDSKGRYGAPRVHAQLRGRFASVRPLCRSVIMWMYGVMAGRRAWLRLHSLHERTQALPE
jgi:hypothetical protein